MASDSQDTVVDAPSSDAVNLPQPEPKQKSGPKVPIFHKDAITKIFKESCVIVVPTKKYGKNCLIYVSDLLQGFALEEVDVDKCGQVVVAPLRDRARAMSTHFKTTNKAWWDVRVFRLKLSLLKDLFKKREIATAIASIPDKVDCLNFVASEDGFDMPNQMSSNIQMMWRAYSDGYKGAWTEAARGPNKWVELEVGQDDDIIALVESFMDANPDHFASSMKQQADEAKQALAPVAQAAPLVAAAAQEGALAPVHDGALVPRAMFDELKGQLVSLMDAFKQQDQKLELMDKTLLAVQRCGNNARDTVVLLTKEFARAESKRVEERAADQAQLARIQKNVALHPNLNLTGVPSIDQSWIQLIQGTDGRAGGSNWLVFSSRVKMPFGLLRAYLAHLAFLFEGQWSNAAWNDNVLTYMQKCYSFVKLVADAREDVYKSCGRVRDSWLHGVDVNPYCFSVKRVEKQIVRGMRLDYWVFTATTDEQKRKMGGDPCKSMEQKVSDAQFAIPSESSSEDHSYYTTGALGNFEERSRALYRHEDKSIGASSGKGDGSQKGKGKGTKRPSSAVSSSSSSSLSSSSSGMSAYEHGSPSPTHRAPFTPSPSLSASPSPSQSQSAYTSPSPPPLARTATGAPLAKQQKSTPTPPFAAPANAANPSANGAAAQPN